jgi:hypothetical protein
MQSKVNILADDMGNVIRQSSNNSEYAYVRLQQDRVTFGNNGWVKKSSISTLLHGKLEDLQSLDLKANATLPGKLIIKEQLEPFSNNDPDRDLKYAGDTGIICCVDGQPIYRKTFYVVDETAQDVLIAHNNGDAIREANGTSTSVKIKNATTKEAFGVDADTVAESVGVEDTVEETVDEVVDEVEETVEEEVLEEETFEL